MPAFAALYAGIFVKGRNAFIDEILMMFPPVFTISFANTCVTRNAEVTFRSNTNFSPLSSRSKKVFAVPSKSGIMVSLSQVARGLFPPAPLIRISTLPNVSVTVLYAASMLFLSRQLVGTASAFCPIFSATAFAASSLISKRATFAPQAASASAKALISTPPAPVMTAVFFDRSI